MRKLSTCWGQNILPDWHRSVFGTKFGPLQLQICTHEVSTHMQYSTAFMYHQLVLTSNELNSVNVGVRARVKSLSLIVTDIAVQHPYVFFRSAIINLDFLLGHVHTKRGAQDKSSRSFAYSTWIICQAEVTSVTRLYARNQQLLSLHHSE